jgi:hypothetical protein
MGWASGSELADQVWRQVRKHVPENKRKAVAQKIIRLFEHHDADDWVGDQQICQDAKMYQDER